MKEPIKIENEELRVRAIESGQAFPSVQGDMGLTKRELFAAMAMFAMLPYAHGDLQKNAHDAVIMADLLLEELEK
jgi:hypothetical protein